MPDSSIDENTQWGLSSNFLEFKKKKICRFIVYVQNVLYVPDTFSLAYLFYILLFYVVSKKNGTCTLMGRNLRRLKKKLGKAAYLFSTISKRIGWNGEKKIGSLL